VGTFRELRLAQAARRRLNQGEGVRIHLHGPLTVGRPLLDPVADRAPGPVEGNGQKRIAAQRLGGASLTEQAHARRGKGRMGRRLLRRQGGADRGGHRADVDHRQEAGHELRHIAHRQQYGIPRLDAAVRQACGDR